MPVYSEKAQPYLDAIAESVFTSQDVRDWLIKGTPVESNYARSGVLFDEQCAVRWPTKRTKQPFWANYWCGRDSRCTCRIEVLHLTGAVSRQSIPDEDGRRTQLPVELAQKLDDECRIDVSRVQPEKQMHGVAFRRDAQCPDDGDLLVQAGALSKHGRAAARTPAAAHERRHQQTGFVDEHQPGFQVRSVFFTRAQSTFTQRRMAFSSRSTARRVGFCGLQPNPLSSLPIWST